MRALAGKLAAKPMPLILVARIPKIHNYNCLRKLMHPWEPPRGLSTSEFPKQGKKISWAKSEQTADTVPIRQRCGLFVPPGIARVG